jgi:hypothetical protein
VTEISYAIIWVALLVLSWNPLALGAWAIWTAVPFLLAAVE